MFPLSPAILPQTSVTDYTNAKPDPVAAFSGPVCSHMNADHMGDTLAIVKHYTGMSVDSITLLDIDRLGMNAVVKRKGDTFKVGGGGGAPLGIPGCMPFPGCAAMM